MVPFCISPANLTWLQKRLPPLVLSTDPWTFLPVSLGGAISDKLNLKMGLGGRLWLITILLILEGIMISVFSYTKTIPGAIITMCSFSIFTQGAEGAIYGVVPYVSKLYTGSVAGLVGAGGNLGSVLYGFGFRSLPYRYAFIMMGSVVIASSALSIFIKISCHAGLLSGEDNHAIIQARERFLNRRAAIEEHARMTGAAGADSGTEAATTNNEQGDEPMIETTVPSANTTNWESTTFPLLSSCFSPLFIAQHFPTFLQLPYALLKAQLILLWLLDNLYTFLH